jgi:hypothetical protein
MQVVCLPKSDSGDLVMRTPWYYIKTGYRGLRRIIAWLPVLWNDEDWAPEYLFEIMRFKISRMRQEIEKNAYHVSYKKEVRRMQVAEELLRRAAIYNFYDQLSRQRENREKNGKCSCPDNALSLDREPGEFGDCYLIDRSCSYCKSLRAFWFRRQQAKEQEDFAFLFRHLEKYAKKWWD